MPDLHTPTLFLAMTIASLGLGAITWAAWKWLDRQPALLAWAAAHLLWSGSMLLLIGRDILPDALSILVANALILASAIGVWWGVATFSGRPLPLLGTVGVCAVYAVAFPWFTWVHPDMNIRIITLRLLVMVAFVGALCILRRSKRRMGGSLPVKVGIAGLLPTLIVMVVSTAGTALQYQQENTFFQHSMIIFSSVGALVANLAWGFAVLFMVMEQRTALRHQDAAVHHFLAEQSLVGMYTLEGERFSYVNKACADLFGYGPQVLVDTMRVVDLVVPEQRDVLAENLRLYAQGAIEGRHFRYHARRRTGEVIEVEGEARLTHWQGRHVVVGVIMAASPPQQSEHRQAMASLATDAPVHL